MAAINWKTGISGNWSLANNWSSNTVPTGLDNVTIDASGIYTVNVDSNFVVNSFIYNATSTTIDIQASRFLTVSHGATITGGNIDGPGTLRVFDVSVINAGPALTLGGDLTFLIAGGSSLSVASPINVGDAAGPAATISNSGTVNLLSDAAGLGVNPSGMANFQNAGTLAKTGGTGTSRFAASITGSGPISVTTGALEIDGPSSTIGGVISGTGTVAFAAGNTQLQVNPTISNFLVDGGAVKFTPNLNYFGNFAETAGSLTLSGNTPTITGSFTMTGGALNFNAGATFTLPATTGFSGGTITGGTVVMNGTRTSPARLLFRPK